MGSAPRSMDLVNEQPIYHSSGRFSLDPAREKRHLGQLSLEDPALAVLWMVQAAVDLGAQAIALRLSHRRVSLFIQRDEPLPDRPPAPCDRLIEMWPEFRREERGYSWQRKIGAAQLRREVQFLRERARFCPVPLKLDGHIVQPESTEFRSHSSQDWVPSGYHLAEHYTASPAGQPGLSLFRPDGQRRSQRINTSSTFWRECQGEVGELSWGMPWRVAGQVARLKRCRGFHCSQAALLLAQVQQPSWALAVHRGVVVDNRQLAWPELPGLQLIYDASSLALDLSGLRLVDSQELQQRLQQSRRQLGSWVQDRAPSWSFESRGNNVTSRQSRREIGAWLSVWSLGLLTGTAMYLPLPLLALPWIVWHHRSRTLIYRAWRQRLRELQASG